MLNKIIEFSVKNKLIIGLFTIALIAYGAYQTTRLPIDAVPDITSNQVQIITVAPSFGATDIERLVTFPIEQVTSNIDGKEEIRSFSRFGLSVITIVFNDETDIYRARQQVAERLQTVQSQIPQGIGKPELGPITTGLGEIYQYVVRPLPGFEKKYDEMQLRTLQDWIVRRQLIGVDGVAEVSSFGGKLKQYEIAVNSNKLQSYNISINDVFTALEKNNQNTGGAYIEKGPTVLFIRSEGLIGSKEDIENTVVFSLEEGRPVFIKDIAEVNIGYATRYGALCYNNEGEVAGGIVMMLKGANSSKVIKNVKERIAQIQKTLPKGVVIEPFLDRTKMVNNAISTVETNLIEGALIVVFILVLFLGNVRAGLLVASVIPLAMLFAIIMMNTFGVSGNLMSLGALDFGLIVDGAVIIVEAVMHQLHGRSFAKINQLSQNEMDTQVKSSAGKMMNSAVFGQVIILIVYLPIFTLQGIEGKMFKPMAQTVAFALMGAFILSLTYIPMMSSVLLSKKIKHKANFSDRIMLKIENLYLKFLKTVLRYRKIVLATVITLFVSAIVVLLFLGGEFIPELEEGDFAVETRVLTGSNLNTTIDYTQKAAGILKAKFPEVEKVVTKIGSGEVPTDPMPMEASDMMVILKDKKEWTSAKTFNELENKMTEALAEVPGISTGFQFPVQMRFNELMTGARQDVVCKIFGENLDTLLMYAQTLGKLITTVKGTGDLYIEPVSGMPQVIISYNRGAIARHNLSIEHINRVVNTAFAGQSSGVVFEGEKRFDLVVRLQNTARSTFQDVRNLLIPTSQGTYIPLYQLADVQIKNGPNQIQREDAKRRIVVGFNVKEGDVQSIVTELQDKVNKAMVFPAGYYITYGGAFENLNAAKDRLMIAVPVAMTLIFLLLFFAFNSIKQGLLIYSAIPLSAIGGIFFLALRGMPFSISAGVGFIALFGVAVLNGIVLVAEFNRLKASGITSINRIVITGTKTRLRPVLMTAFVASLGFLPMALSNGSGAEVQRPLATVVIGGLMIATFLTLFVLPILYCLIERSGKMPLAGKAGAITILLIFLFNQHGAAQNISLKAAIDSALKNNLKIKNERLKAEYQQKLIGSYANIPQTNVTGEAGQINSYYADTRFVISQSINFPTVYSNQKKVLKEEWKVSSISLALNEAELKRSVSILFNATALLREKEKLLLKTDSMYFNFEKRAELRFEKGETNILEKLSAQTQRNSIQLQLKTLQNEIEILKMQLQIAMNTAVVYDPEINSLKLELNLKADSSVSNDHPFIQQSLQQKSVAKAQFNLEKSKLMPELNFGYSNMSIRGTGADNIVYDASQRFSSAQIGLGIPLFFGSQKARIKASKTNVLIAETAYSQKMLEMQTQLKAAFFQYRNNLEVVNNYEKVQLQNAKTITETSNKQLQNGEINYMDWIILNNQSVIIQSNYIDALKTLNENIILINYLINK